MPGAAALCRPPYVIFPCLRNSLGLGEHEPLHDLRPRYSMVAAQDRMKWNRVPSKAPGIKDSCFFNLYMIFKKPMYVVNSLSKSPNHAYKEASVGICEAGVLNCIASLSRIIELISNFCRSMMMKIMIRIKHPWIHYRLYRLLKTL